MTPVRWLAESLDDLDRVGAYVEQFDDIAARSVIAAIVGAAARLERYPLSGTATGWEGSAKALHSAFPLRAVIRVGRTRGHRPRHSPRRTPPSALKTVGLLGGSFNPAHAAHRHVSVEAMRRLGLDEVWWLVSPQNPLKDAAGMAPLVVRMASARTVARHPRIRVTDIETRLGTRFTADTVAALVRRCPHIRFIWLMGADNLVQFHRWRDWRRLARTVPIAVVARPRYMGEARGAPAMAWLGRWRHASARARAWREWELPAIVMLDIRMSPLSATAIRARDPDWAADVLQPHGQPEQYRPR